MRYNGAEIVVRETSHNGERACSGFIGNTGYWEYWRSSSIQVKQCFY